MTLTFLQAINAVLRRLREDPVASSNSTDYSKLIGDFVNQAMYDCEHAWDWNCLQEVITITTAAGDNLYDFHNADVKIIEVINETKRWVMRPIENKLDHRFEYLDDPVNDSPYYYSFRGLNGDYSQVKIFPTPTGVESLRFLTVKYTRNKDVDGTDDSEIISVPWQPVVLSAYAQAISERGEDGGISYNEADSHARSALADAISLDMSLNHPLQNQWYAY